MTAPGGKFLAKLKGENPDVPDASAMLSKQQQRQPPGATRGTGADTAGMIGAESELAPKLEKNCKQEARQSGGNSRFAARP